MIALPRDEQYDHHDDVGKTDNAPDVQRSSQLLAALVAQRCVPTGTGWESSHDIPGFGSGNLWSEGPARRCATTVPMPTLARVLTMKSD